MSEEFYDFEEDYDPPDPSVPSPWRYKTPDWAPEGWISGDWIHEEDGNCRWAHVPLAKGFGLEELRAWVWSSSRKVDTELRRA
jgi:hypothetical protein